MTQNLWTSVLKEAITTDPVELRNGGKLEISFTLWSDNQKYIHAKADINGERRTYEGPDFDELRAFLTVAVQPELAEIYAGEFPANILHSVEVAETTIY